MARTGRRPGAGGTRERILAAARSDFGKTGYEGTTIRGIAAQAKVDPALVMHYFESKDGVFLAAVEFPADPAEFIPRLLAPGLDGLGERLVRFFLETWGSPARRPMLAPIRSVVCRGEAAATLRGVFTRECSGAPAAQVPSVVGIGRAAAWSVRSTGPPGSSPSPSSSARSPTSG